MSRVVRIQEDAAEIALSYGPNISEGIRVMHALLSKQRQCSFDIELIRQVMRDELERLQGY